MPVVTWVAWLIWFERKLATSRNDGRLALQKNRSHASFCCKDSLLKLWLSVGNSVTDFWLKTNTKNNAEYIIFLFKIDRSNLTIKKRDNLWGEKLSDGLTVWLRYENKNRKLTNQWLCQSYPYTPDSSDSPASDTRTVCQRQVNRSALALPVLAHCRQAWFRAHRALSWLGALHSSSGHSSQKRPCLNQLLPIVQY